MLSIPIDERVMIGSDSNGHVGEGNRGDEEDKGRAEDKVMEAEKGRVRCGFQRGVEALSGQEVLPDDWTTTANVIRETDKRVLGVSSGRKADNETWCWNEEVQECVERKVN